MEEQVVTTFALLLFSFLYILIFSLFFNWLLRPDLIERKLKKVLIAGIKHKTINNIEDVYTIVKGLKNTNKSNNDQRQEVSKILRKLIVSVHGKLEKESEKSEQIELLKSLKTLLEENSKVSPYSELPVHERNVINDVLAFLKNGDEVSVKMKISELSNLLINANEIKTKSAKDTKKSYLLGIISAILTVISLFISL